MKFALHLLREGAINVDDFVEAIECQEGELVPLGQIAIEEGRLSMRQVFQVLRAQSDMAGCKFGDAAVELGLLNRSDVAELLMQQADRRRSMPDLLVEMGALTRARMEAELQQFRRVAERQGSSRRRLNNEVPPLASASV